MDPYEQLLDEYVAELTVAKEYAEGWWASLLESETQLLGDETSAEESLNERWPFGPTAHPRVVAVYRKYYRACSAISNDLDARAAAEDEEEEPSESEEDWGEVEEEEDGHDDDLTSIPTGAFMIDYLCDESDELGEFLLNMVFVPIETADEHVLPKDLKQHDANGGAQS